MVIGILLALPSARAPRAPEAHALGRAALALRAEGVGCVIGEVLRERRMTGFLAEPGAWRPVVDQPVAALYHRFPSRSRPEQFGVLLAQARGAPVGNAPSLVELCDDKLATQSVLEAAGLPVPPVEHDPSRFPERLSAWGAGFVKPRFGAFGQGVARVERVPTLDPALGPWLLQRAIAPPEGVAGVSVRQLVQRDPASGWVACSAVTRVSDDDPVVNVARGARVGGPELLGAGVAARVAALSIAAAYALEAAAGGLAVELGVDLVIDRDGVPWLVEVNGKPRGRLAELAAADPARWGEEHLAVCLRPLRALAAAATGS